MSDNDRGTYVQIIANGQRVFNGERFRPVPESPIISPIPPKDRGRRNNGAQQRRQRLRRAASLWDKTQ